MGDFPEIIPSEPVIKPAEQEKIFDKLWLSKLEVHAEEGPQKPVSIRIDLVPSSGAEILQAPITSAIIPDAFGLAAQDPEFAQVLGGVILMANKYKDGIKAEEPPQEEII